MRVNDAICIFVHSRTRQHNGLFALFYSVIKKNEKEKSFFELENF